jgi:uncharacterized protein YndB with AHSA1/START domain
MGDHFMRYQVDVAADRDAVRRALTTEDGIKGWWTDTAEVPESLGERLVLTFPSVPQPFDLELAEASGDRVVWRAGSFPPFWEGTTIRWDVGDNPDGDGVRILMTHEGWDRDNPAIGRVNVGWGQILGKLKGFTETGDPDPFFVN